jgi:hypothetical protein
MESILSSTHIGWVLLMYYISSPVLVIIGLIALYQIILAKRTLRVTSQRESACLAAQQCEKMAHEIVPINDNLIKQLVEQKIPYYQGPVDFNNANLKSNKVALVFISQCDKDLNKIITILKILNSLDAFSLYFMKGVADEEIAFTSVGSTFCSIVKIFSPFIALLNQDQHAYLNIQALYNIWSQRIEKMKLQDQLSSIRESIDKIVDEGPTPIGV